MHLRFSVFLFLILTVSSTFASDTPKRKSPVKELNTAKAQQKEQTMAVQKDSSPKDGTSSGSSSGRKEKEAREGGSSNKHMEFLTVVHAAASKSANSSANTSPMLRYEAPDPKSTFPSASGGNFNLDI